MLTQKVSTQVWGPLQGAPKNLDRKTIFRAIRDAADWDFTGVVAVALDMRRMELTITRLVCNDDDKWTVFAGELATVTHVYELTN